MKYKKQVARTIHHSQLTIHNNNQLNNMKKHYYIAILISVMAAMLITSCTKKPLYTAPLGVQAYTFRHSFPKDVAATLDTIKMLGFTELEGGGGRMAPEEFRKMCEERGISIPATGTGY